MNEEIDTVYEVEEFIGADEDWFVIDSVRVDDDESAMDGLAKLRDAFPRRMFRLVKNVRTVLE